MNRKSFVSAAAVAALALAMGANAVAADATTSSGFSKPGISYANHGGRGGLKDLVVEAGTNPNTVELHFAGAQRVTFGDVGTLLIVKADGSLWRYKPAVYQMVDGKRKDLTVAFHFLGADRVSLKVSKLNSSAPLIVSPVGERAKGDS